MLWPTPNIQKTKIGGGCRRLRKKMERVDWMQKERQRQLPQRWKLKLWEA